MCRISRQVAYGLPAIRIFQSELGGGFPDPIPSIHPSVFTAADPNLATSSSEFGRTPLWMHTSTACGNRNLGLPIAAGLFGERVSGQGASCSP